MNSKTIATRAALRALVITSVALAALSANAYAQSIVTPTFLSGTNLNTDTSLGFAPENLTNNIGLAHNVNTGDSLVSVIGVTQDNTYSGEWASGGTAGNYFDSIPPAVFVFDLGQNYNLNNLVLWQYQGTSNGNQARDFSLRFSNSANGATFSGNPVFSGTLGYDAASSQVFSFASTTARYAELTITSNYAGIAPVGGDRVGLGKVRFAAAVVPEAGTPTLMVSAMFLVGGAIVRRRKK